MTTGVIAYLTADELIQWMESHRLEIDYTNYTDSIDGIYKERITFSWDSLYNGRQHLFADDQAGALRKMLEKALGAEAER